MICNFASLSVAYLGNVSQVFCKVFIISLNQLINFMLSVKNNVTQLVNHISYIYLCDNILGILPAWQLTKVNQR